MPSSKDAINDYRNRYRGLLESEGEEAAASREGQQNWNSKEAANDYADSMSSHLFRPYMENAMDLRGRQVGQGRTRTGFGFEDEDRYYRDAYAQPLAESIGMQAGKFAGMDLMNLTERSKSQNRYGDALASAYDVEVAQENAKNKKKGGILGAAGAVVGGVGGFFLSGGNPWGAYVGAQAGSALGGSLA
jgi:hypothetical protein